MILCKRSTQAELTDTCASPPVQFSKRGRATVQRSEVGAAAGPMGPLLLQHDRRKELPIDGTVADPFLQKIGLQTSDGRIKANMQVSRDCLRN